MKTKKKKTWLIVLLVLLLLAAAIVLVPRFLLPSAAQTAVGSYTVGLGNVSVTITGSGTLAAEDTSDIDLPVGVKVAAVFAEEGDAVAAGDVLATLDTSSLEYRAAELSEELTALDRSLGTRRTTGTIVSPVKGRVKYLPAAVEDDVLETVNRYGSLALLSSDGLMQLELHTDATLALNTDVTVKWPSGSADGTVVSRTENGYLVTLDDKDAPYLESAEVYYNAALVGSGRLYIHAPVAIFGNGGTIKQVNVKLNDQASLNATLFTLDNEPATDSYRKTLADRSEKAELLQTVLRYLAAPSVTAPVDGVVSSVALTEGKKTASTDNSGSVTAFTLGTGGAVKMTVAVDELDVNNVAVGQSADVTLDAFASETFTATVTRISRLGKASGSITTYDTDLLLDSDARLLTGMNGSAVILSDSVENVPILPLGALHEDADGSFVYVLSSKDEQTKTYVTTGLSDGAYAQVLTGIGEGTRVVYTDPAASTSMFPMGMGFGSMRNMNTASGGSGNE